MLIMRSNADTLRGLILPRVAALNKEVQKLDISAFNLCRSGVDSTRRGTADISYGLFETTSFCTDASIMSPP